MLEYFFEYDLHIIPATSMLWYDFVSFRCRIVLHLQNYIIDVRVDRKSIRTGTE